MWRWSAKISAFSFKTLVGTPEPWHAFEESKILCLPAQEKKGWSFPLHDFPVASMMGWFLYYTIHLMIECAVLSDSRSLMEYWWIVRLLTIFEKMFKTGWYFIITRNDFRIIYRCNFLRGHHFVRQKWFYRFPKHFLMSHVFFEMF